MSETTQFAVLDHIVDVLQSAIPGSKLKTLSPSEFNLLDGNAAINLKQGIASDGKTTEVVINDKTEILYSEELLETIYRIHEDVTYDDDFKAALINANVIVNGLNIEAELIFYSIRDQFYALSGSYEFLKFIERDIQRIKFNMTFGDHQFEITIVNDPTAVDISAVFASSIAPAVKETISTDLAKVKAEINSQFKKG